MTAYLAGTDKSYVLTVTTLKVANGRASVAGVTRTPNSRSRKACPCSRRSHTAAAVLLSNSAPQ
ncbi:MAG: hypothetical protein QOJ83_556 [Frankiales bacterium]|jgi:hypothetical protein|nr:hypothetical protein [Frankiales bacterium]